jgi:hypothetical protein
MTNQEHGGTEYVTLTAVGSKPLASPDGTTALMLQTQERGAIAFRVDQRAINTIRAQLVICETILRSQGNA